MRFFIGTLLLWSIAYATINANYPKIYSPYSFTVIVPVLALHEIFRDGRILSYTLGTLIIPLLFLLWSFPLLHGQEQIPNRTKYCAVLLVLLSMIMLIVSWPYGIQYQGLAHTIAIYVMNVISWTVLILLYRSNKAHSSYASNYIFHWALFAWLAWVAFPWLGELL